jgi:hypothetical protein
MDVRRGSKTMDMRWQCARADVSDLLHDRRRCSSGSRSGGRRSRRIVVASQVRSRGRLRRLQRRSTDRRRHIAETKRRVSTWHKQGGVCALVCARASRVIRYYLSLYLASATILFASQVKIKVSSLTRGGEQRGSVCAGACVCVCVCARTFCVNFMNSMPPMNGRSTSGTVTPSGVW